MTRPRKPPKPKRGRPRIKGPRPWELANMSRRTWYRRKAEIQFKRGDVR